MILKMWVATVIFAVIIMLFLDIVCAIITGKSRARFYQIWLKEEFLSPNFFIMSGKEKKSGLRTHNGLFFDKKQYRYVILPFINAPITNFDIARMNETDYINMCLKMTDETLNEYEKAE